MSTNCYHVVLENVRSPQKEGLRNFMRQECWRLKSQIFNVKYELILEFPKECEGSNKNTPCLGGYGTHRNLLLDNFEFFLENSDCIALKSVCCREQLLIKDVELNHNGEKILEKLVRRHY